MEDQGIDLSPLLKLEGLRLEDTDTHDYRIALYPGSPYQVIISRKKSTGEIQCSCRGWRFKKPGKARFCKHVSLLKLGGSS